MRIYIDQTTKQDNSTAGKLDASGGTTGAKEEVSKIYNEPGRKDNIGCRHAMEFGIVECVSVKTKRNEASQVILKLLSLPPPPNRIEMQEHCVEMNEIEMEHIIH